MEHQPLTGCRYTIVRDYHDLRTKSRILIEPIDKHHPRGVDAGVLAVETIRLERIIQEEIDQLNAKREKDDWLDSQYNCDSQEQGWTRNPNARPPLLFRRPTRFDQKPDQEPEKAEQPQRQVKSDIDLRQQENKHPTAVRRVCTHEHPLHNNHRTDKHRPGHENYAKHVRPRHAHGHHHPPQPHNRHHTQAHHQQKQKPHGGNSRKQHNQSDNMHLVQQPGLPAQALNQGHHPELGVLDKLFPDDGNKHQHNKNPPHDKHAQLRRHASRPVLHRVHSSKGKLARHNPQRPLRPILRRTETHLENIPKRDAKQQQQHSKHHSKHHAKKQVKFLPLLPHKGDDDMRHNPTTTTHHSTGVNSDRDDQEAPQHEDEPHPSHREAIECPSSGNRPSASAGKTPMPRRSTFIVGPDSNSSPSDSGTPRDDATTGKGVEAEAANSPQRRQQPTATAGQGDEERHRDTIERLRQRRKITFQDDYESSCSDDDDEEEVENKSSIKTPKAQPALPAAPAPTQQQDAQPHPSSRSKAEDPQQSSAAAAAGGRGGKAGGNLDAMKEEIRRRILAEANEDAVGSDDEESETDDEETPKARPLPPHMQRHQKQPRALPGPSSQSRAQRQEDVRKQLLGSISAKGGNVQSAIKEEEEEEEENAAERDAPPTCASSKEGYQPSSLLTQGLIAERVQKAEKAEKARRAAAAAAAQVADAHGWLQKKKKKKKKQQQLLLLQGDHDHQHQAVPKQQAPLTITTQVQPQDAANRGIPEVITTVVHDAAAVRAAHKQETRKSLREMANLAWLGRQTGLPLRRIEEEDDKKREEDDRKKQVEEEEEEAQQEGNQQRKVARAEERDFTAAAHASAHAAAVAGGGAEESRPPRRAFHIGHHILDHRYDYLRSQPMPKRGWGIHW